MDDAFLKDNCTEMRHGFFMFPKARELVPKRLCPSPFNQMQLKASGNTGRSAYKMRSI